jgi:hypothetical protein
MAEQNMFSPEGRYSPSDRLAIALACLAGVMAIVLFLVEKTPFWVVTLLVLMLALSVYPILHFVRLRPLRVICLIAAFAVSVGIGWTVWPKVKTSATTAEVPPKNTVKETIGATDEVDVVVHHPTETGVAVKVERKQSQGKKGKTPQSATVNQDCGGGNCAISLGQRGGTTAGEINHSTPDNRYRCSDGRVLDSEADCSKPIVFPPSSMAIGAGFNGTIAHNVFEGAGVGCVKSDQQAGKCNPVVQDNVITNSNSALENAGSIGTANVENNLVRAPNGGNATAVKNDRDGKIDNLTVGKNDVGSSASVPSITQQCAPGSSCAISNGQIGGVTAGTINNYGAIGRHLSAQQRKEISDCIGKKPGHFGIVAVANAEAQGYAQDWLDVFNQAGNWVNDEKSKQGMDIGVVMFMGGSFFAGMRIAVHDGDPSIPPSASKLLPGSVEENFYQCINLRNDLPQRGVLVAYPNTPTGYIGITIADEPR